MVCTNNCSIMPLTIGVTHGYNTWSANIPNDTTAGCMPGWCGTLNEWIRLNENMRREYDNIAFVDYSHDDNYPREIHHPIKISDCPKCNSNLPLRQTDDKGICKCEFCGKEVYVW